MTLTQKQYVKGSVLMGVGLATVTTFFIVTIYGAFAPSNYLGGLSNAANTTGWSMAIELFGEASILELVIPLIIVALIIIGLLFLILGRCALMGGLSE